MDILGNQSPWPENRCKIWPTKVFYQIAYTDRSELNEYIRLDVLYEDCPYSNIQELPIDSPFIKLDGEPLLVTVPKKEDILGDKMTALPRIL